MKFSRKLLVVTLIAVLTLSVVGCGVKKAEVEVKVNRIPVEVAEVKEGLFSKAVVLSGVTKANSTVTVLPKVMGAERITAVKIKTGDRVKQGQVIAILDQSTVAIQLNSAQTTYDDAARNYERNKILFEAGAMPKSAIEQMEVGMRQAKNALDAQRLAYENTIIKSPISGTVTSVMAEVGNLASGQSPIAVIVNIDSVEISCSINEMQVNKLTAGDEVEVIIPSVGEEVFFGKISNISPAMDERSKAYALNIILKNKEGKIKAGMYTQVRVVTDIVPNAVIIPAKAIVTRGGEDRVFVVEEDKAVIKEVIIGLSNGKETQIIKGISKGEKIIIRGNEDVVNGDLVIVVERGEK